MPDVSDFQGSKPAVSRGRQLVDLFQFENFLLAPGHQNYTTTKIYTHGVLLCCVSCPRKTDSWCCAISSSTAFFLFFFYIGLFYIAISCAFLILVMHREKLVNFACLCTNVVARFHRSVSVIAPVLTLLSPQWGHCNVTEAKIVWGK